jgi:hypothetical protein
MTGREFNRRFRPLLLSGLISVFSTGCTTPPGTRPEPATASRDAQTTFVGTVWISTDATSAPGTLRIFLPDGTLVMGFVR